MSFQFQVLEQQPQEATALHARKYAQDLKVYLALAAVGVLVLFSLALAVPLLIDQHEHQILKQHFGNLDAKSLQNTYDSMKKMFDSIKTKVTQGLEEKDQQISDLQQSLLELRQNSSQGFGRLQKSLESIGLNVTKEHEVNSILFEEYELKFNSSVDILSLKHDKELQLTKSKLTDLESSQSESSNQVQALKTVLDGELQIVSANLNETLTRINHLNASFEVFKLKIVNDFQAEILQKLNASQQNYLGLKQSMASLQLMTNISVNNWTDLLGQVLQGNVQVASLEESVKDLQEDLVQMNQTLQDQIDSNADDNGHQIQDVFMTIEPYGSYHALHKLLTFEQAKQTCQDLNSHMIVFSNENYKKKMSAISAVFTRLLRAFWIGKILKKKENLNSFKLP